MKENETKIEKPTVTISEDAYKKVKMLKAEFSVKKGKTLTWDEFFGLLINRERKIRDYQSWLYTIGIFIVITFVLMLPLYIAAPLQTISMIPIFLIIGLIVAFFSGYVITPLTLRGIIPFDNAPPQVLKSVEELSKKAEIKNHPKLMIAVTPEINAMVYTSISGNRVCVTKGLMDAYQSGKITEEELNAIIGHEIGHIRNLDYLKWSLVLSWISIFDAIGTLLMLIGQGMANIGVVLSESEETYVIEKGGSGRYVARKEGGIIGLLVELVGWSLYLSGILQKLIAKIASILASHLSRKQEHAADAVGAELTSPEKMSVALQKITALNNELVAEKIASLPYADRWQLQPHNPSWIDKLFYTHPPTEKRDAELRKINEFL